MRSSLQLFLLSILISVSLGFQDCGGQANQLPLITSEPILIKEVNLGRKYLISDQSGENFVHIVSVRGTDNQQGFAYGQLMADEIRKSLTGFYKYLEWQGYDALIKLKIPSFIAKALIKGGRSLLDQVLDLTYFVTKKYTPSYIDEELRGIAQGSGLDYKSIRRLNLFPELIKAACTAFGAWGDATPDRNLYHLRSLDWDKNATIVDYPTIVVYHKSTEDSVRAYANIGYAGLIGVLTGFSTEVGIGEKVWYPNDKEVKNTRFGEPWNYVLKDMLKYGKDLNSAIGILQKAKRTCKIHLGVGSMKEMEFRGILYSSNVLKVYDDKNYTYTDAHPQRNGIMFFDKHVQPSGNRCIGEIVKQYHGKIDAEVIYRQLAPLHQTGDTQVCVMDYKNQVIYLQNSKRGINPINAWQRPIIRVNLKKFFDEF